MHRRSIQHKVVERTVFTNGQVSYKVVSANSGNTYTVSLNREPDGTCIECGNSGECKTSCSLFWTRTKESGWSCTCQHGVHGPLAGDCSHILAARVTFVAQVHKFIREYDMYNQRAAKLMVRAILDGDYPA